jgi:uncharacterized protein HemY
MRQELSQIAGRLQQLHSGANALLMEDPFHPEGLRLLGQHWLGRRQWQNALYPLNYLMAHGAGDASAWVSLGLTLAHLDAMPAFLAQWPEPPPAGEESPWMQLARACAATQQWDAAEAVLERGEPAVGPPLLALGTLATQTGQFERANGYLQEAIRANPDDPVPWLLLTDLAIHRNDRLSAQTHLDRARELGASEEAVQQRRERMNALSAPPAGAITLPPM